jgi:hypothetical protein
MSVDTQPIRIERLLLRQAPQPVPAIFPVPEYLATGERQRQYDEMKTALRVPWMGVVTMAYAHYPGFFRTLWQGLQPIVGSAAFARQNLELRALVEYEVRSLAPSQLGASLREMGYAPREIDAIRQLLEIFSHGNFSYLTIATLVRLLLEGHDLLGPSADDASLVEAMPIAYADAPLTLMEAHHADAPTRGRYEDIKQTLGLPFVNTDYRALARWPSYFEQAWSGLKPVVVGKAHAALCETVHHEAVERVRHALPNPSSLDAMALQSAARGDAPLVEVLQVAGLFQWLLPGLVTNIAFLRAQLLED